MRSIKNSTREMSNPRFPSTQTKWIPLWKGLYDKSTNIRFWKTESRNPLVDTIPVIPTGPRTIRNHLLSLPRPGNGLVLDCVLPPRILSLGPRHHLLREERSSMCHHLRFRRINNLGCLVQVLGISMIRSSQSSSCSGTWGFSTIRRMQLC